MFSVTVRDHMMIAHSFRGEVFGPRSSCMARRTSSTPRSAARTLDADNIVVDIGRASEELHAVLGRAQLPQPRRRGRVRRHEHLDRGAGAGRRRPAGRPDHAGALGDGARELDGLVVTLHESHIAWASYERPL